MYHLANTCTNWNRFAVFLLFGYLYHMTKIFVITLYRLISRLTTYKSLNGLKLTRSNDLSVVKSTQYKSL